MVLWYNAINCLFPESDDDRNTELRPVKLGASQAPKLKNLGTFIFFGTRAQAPKFCCRSMLLDSGKS